MSVLGSVRDKTKGIISQPKGTTECTSAALKGLYASVGDGFMVVKLLPLDSTKHVSSSVINNISNVMIKRVKGQVVIDSTVV